MFCRFFKIMFTLATTGMAANTRLRSALKLPTCVGSNLGAGDGT